MSAETIEMLRLYVKEKGVMPPIPTDLIAFAQTKGVKLEYIDAKKIIANPPSTDIDIINEEKSNASYTYNRLIKIYNDYVIEKDETPSNLFDLVNYIQYKGINDIEVEDISQFLMIHNNNDHLNENMNDNNEYNESKNDVIYEWEWSSHGDSRWHKYDEEINDILNNKLEINQTIQIEIRGNIYNITKLSEDTAIQTNPNSNKTRNIRRGEMSVNRKNDQVAINRIVNIIGCDINEAQKIYVSSGRNAQAAINYLLEKKTDSIDDKEKYFMPKSVESKQFENNMNLLFKYVIQDNDDENENENDKQYHHNHNNGNNDNDDIYGYSDNEDSPNGK